MISHRRRRSQRTNFKKQLHRKCCYESLESRDYLAITIFAAGETGQESMELRIDDQIVQTWNNVGGNPANRQFLAFQYNGASNVNPDRIRIGFTNDLFVDPFDRNLVIDRIVVDGTTYQTEAPTVYSTGSWLPEDGVQAGFRQSEVLNADGYFQFAVNTGSLIQVFAAGSVGPEKMELQIDGRTAYSWSAVGGNATNRRFNEFTYQAAGAVLPSQIRVLYTNDLYQPPIDYNLRVDKIIVDGIEKETEAPSVFSTGTWVGSLNRIQAGYQQSEWLNVNGYFQYDAKVANPGNIGLEQSVYAVREGVATADLFVTRFGGSDGTITVDYRTGDGTAVATRDYTTRSGTLSFAPGETRKRISIPIINDAAIESPETFSFVIENVTGGGTLLAPRTATVTITDDDLVLPNYTSFANSNGLKLNGNATIASNAVQLTPNLASQRGTAFYNTAIPVQFDTSFQSQFQFSTTGGTNGGEGFTWIVQNNVAGASALGGVGRGLGYEGIGRSFAIEFDTVRQAGEIDNNHISIWTNGLFTTSLSTRNVGIDFNSGAIINAWVDYSGDSDLLALYLSTSTTKPTTPIATVSLDLFGLVGNKAFFGFGASTGVLSNVQRILQWKLNLDRPQAPATPPNTRLVTEDVVTGLALPTAVDFSPDGRNMYVAQKDGQIIVVRDGVKQSSPFIDISSQVNNVRDRGLLDIAIHPNFPATPYVYLLFTYDPTQVYQNANDPNAGPDQPGNRAARLIRVTADSATNFTRAVAGSEVVLLGKNSTWNNYNGFINSTFNITAPQGGLNPDGTYVEDYVGSESESHTIGSLAFSPDGSLFVSTGDGASYNEMDPRATKVQDIDSLNGKILRINPIDGRGYTDNPFYNGNPQSNRSKVFQYGLRNPFRIAVNPNNGQLFVGDVGWTNWEEINSAAKGANFGWPYYEGGNGTNLRTNSYKDLQKAIDFYAGGQVATSSIYALNHASENINAIVMGAYYSGSTFPEQYRNNIFFNDLGQGIVRAATLNASGMVTGVETFTTGAVYVVQIVQGPDGNLYFVDLDDGKVGRWSFAPAAFAAARSSTTSGITSNTAKASASPVSLNSSLGTSSISAVQTLVTKPNSVTFTNFGRATEALLPMVKKDKVALIDVAIREDWSLDEASDVEDPRLQVRNRLNASPLRRTGNTNLR